jgi:hypothetical protein
MCGRLTEFRGGFGPLKHLTPFSSRGRCRTLDAFAVTGRRKRDARGLGGRFGGIGRASLCLTRRDPTCDPDADHLIAHMRRTQGSCIKRKHFQSVAPGAAAENARRFCTPQYALFQAAMALPR